MKIISIDPGVTTGYCYAELTPKERLVYYPFQNTEDVDDFWRRLQKFEPRYIIIESFQFRQGKQRSGINLFPRELIGVARLYSLIADHPVALYLQSAATGKSYYRDATLKALGLRKLGDATKLVHGIDASRHLLQWVTFGAGYEFNSGKQDFIKRIEIWPPSLVGM